MAIQYPKKNVFKVKISKALNYKITKGSVYIDFVLGNRLNTKKYVEVNDTIIITNIRSFEFKVLQVFKKGKNYYCVIESTNNLPKYFINHLNKHNDTKTITS